MSIKLNFIERIVKGIKTYTFEESAGIPAGKYLHNSLVPPITLHQLYSDIINDLIVSKKEYVSYNDYTVEELETILKGNKISVIIGKP